MRKVVVSEFMALDGVVEEPMWTFEFESEDRNQYKYEELKESDALLLGRVTYEGFAAAWPNMEEQTGDYGKWMNNYPKYVVSKTLKELTWNNSIQIRDNVAEEVAKLKRQPGRNILVFGSTELVKTLMQHDLVDEYRLMIFPVVVGNGRRMFKEGVDKKSFKLIDNKTFASGVVVLTYAPGGKA